MSHSPPPVSPRQRPGTVTAAALLTWISAGFLITMGLLLVIADRTGDQPFRRALTEAVGIGVSMPGDITLLTLGIVLLVVGAILALLTVAAFTRSRGGLIGLSIAAGLYLVLTFAAMNDDRTSPLLLFGVVWIAAITVLLWSRRGWFTTAGARTTAPTPVTTSRTTRGAGPTDPSHRRPTHVTTGAVMAGIAGAALLYFGGQMAWRGFAAFLHPDPATAFAGLGVHIGPMTAAIGAAVLVLTAVTLRGSRDTLVALTVTIAVSGLVLLTPVPSAGVPALTIVLKLGAIAWLLAAVVLLWSRAARGWYRRQGR